MDTKQRVGKSSTVFKASLFLVLTALAANVYAYNPNAMYLGNPNRPDTVWQPPHCDHGCWREGYYIKFLSQPTCRDVVWVDGMYDRSGNWIPAHFKVLRYTVVNPGPEANYVGFPM